MVRKTSEMVEAGILAAVAVLFAILGAYLPVLGALFNLLWPVPVAVCGMRNGLRWSVMTLIVACAVIGSLLGPVKALFILTMWGFPSIVLGECMCRRYKPVKILTFTSLAIAVSFVLDILLSILVLGLNPIAMIFGNIARVYVEIEDYCRAMGMSETEIVSVINMYKEFVANMEIVLPGSLIIASPLLALCNYWGTRKILAKLGITFESLPAFSKWRVPEYLIWPYGLAMIVLAFYADAPELIMNLAINLYYIVGFAFTIQGFAVLFWWLNEKAQPQWIKTVAVFLVITVPLLGMFIQLLGAFESVFDYRKLKERSL